MSYTVYMHVSPSNKRYIGITSQDASRRWRDGKGYKKQEHFYNAIKKYGWENFQHIIIAKGLSEEEAKWLEIELIREWNSFNREHGYNITLGGEGASGHSPSEETREIMRERMSGENNPMYGKNYRDYMTEEAIVEQSKKKSISMSGENHWNYGKNHSEETKRKIGDASRGRKHSEEAKSKISKASKGENNGMYGKGYLISGENHPLYGKHRSEETKRKLGKSIICLTTKRIFHTTVEGAEFYNIKNKSHISRCCKGKLKSCGKFNGEKLVWKYINWNHGRKYRYK